MTIKLKKNALFLQIVSLFMLSLLSACGGGSDATTDSPQSNDTQPESFSFAAQTDVALATVVISEPITVKGINTQTQIKISGVGEYAINGSAYTTATGFINNNDTVRVRLTSAAQANVLTSTTLDIGGVSAAFKVTTKSSIVDPVTDTTPDAFSFTPKNDVDKNSVVESNLVTILGIDAAAAVSITGGEYAINGGSFTQADGSIVNGQTVKVRLTSASTKLQQSTATLTVGGLSASFNVTTKDEFSGVVVDVNFDTAHTVGGIDSFDRKKFITVHSSTNDADWLGNNSQSLNQPNEDPNFMDNFLDGFDVYFGRDTGNMKYELNQLAQDPARAGFVDEAKAKSNGQSANWNYVNFDRFKKAHEHEDRGTDMITGAQQHPYWPEGTLTNQGWALSQADTQAEPLGTATGHYMGLYLAHYFDLTPNNGEVNGKGKPKYLEVMNEPLYDLTTDRAGDADQVDPLDVFRFHNAVATEVRKTNNDVLIGGYTAAFPDFDRDNFQRWIDRDKLFIDTAGANMDFISIHLYDFPQFSNSERYRKGSNIEATFDMLEQYTAINNKANGKAFAPTPLIVSEYGAQTHLLNNKPWSPLRDTLKLRATNSMLMAMIERPHLMLKTIPFIPLKAEWGRKKQLNVPYQSRLMMQKFERDGETSEAWVYTDMVKFYELWSEVKGKRVDSWASDQDILVDAYVDGKDSYIVLNNLEFNDVTLKLNALGIDNNNLTSVKISHLVTADDSTEASLIVETLSDVLPDTLTLQSEATMVIKLNYASDISLNHVNAESKYYATEYFKAITANNVLEFDIENVTLSTQGEAVLRLGIGRDHLKSLTPTVKINGVELNVPSDFRGYDQKQGKEKVGRENFFGVIEVPVPYSALQLSNKVTLEFDDAGGFVSSIAMQVFNTSKVMVRGE